MQWQGWPLSRRGRPHRFANKILADWADKLHGANAARKHKSQLPVLCLLVVLHGRKKLLRINVGWHLSRQAELLQQVLLPGRHRGLDSAQRLRQSRGANHANGDGLAMHKPIVTGDRLDRMAKRVPIIQRGPGTGFLTFVALNDVGLELAASSYDMFENLRTAMRREFSLG